MFKQLKKIFFKYVLKRKYYRTGACRACGKCCTNIYIKHNGVIKDEAEYETLKQFDKFYRDLRVIGKDEIGLIFECSNLNPETHKCNIHKKRPGICRRYPQEEIFKMGGTLAEDCGYKLIPIESFDEVFDRVSKKSKGKSFRICQ